MNTLKSYSDKLLEIQLLKSNNAQVFEDLKIKVDELTELESQLKVEAKEKGDMENDIVRVLVSEKYKKFYDYNKFIASANKMEIDSLKKANGIITEIDKDVFDECYKQGLITVMTKQSSFQEELIGKAVTIKNKLK